jgi:hypothetical protein
MLEERRRIDRLLKENISKANSRMKHMADKHRSDWTFEVGDGIFLKLQPYKRHSLAHRKNKKLASKYFGPYQVIEKVGEVAYLLPPGAKVHPVFHVSLLKRQLE